MTVEATVERFGRLDCAFNNAGIDGRAGLLQEISQVLEQGAGSTVNTAPVAGPVGFLTRRGPRGRTALRR